MGHHTTIFLMTLIIKTSILFHFLPFCYCHFCGCTIHNWRQQDVHTILL